MKTIKTKKAMQRSGYEEDRETPREYARLFLSQGLYSINPLSDAEAQRRKRAVEKRKEKDKIRRKIGDKAKKRNRNR